MGGVELEDVNRAMNSLGLDEWSCRKLTGIAVDRGGVFLVLREAS